MFQPSLPGQTTPCVNLAACREVARIDLADAVFGMGGR